MAPSCKPCFNIWMNNTISKQSGLLEGENTGVTAIKIKIIQVYDQVALLLVDMIPINLLTSIKILIPHCKKYLLRALH